MRGRGLSLHISQGMIALGVLLLLGLISKNITIVISVLVLLLIRITGLGDLSFPVIDKYGIKVGITIIMIAVLIPIAKDEIKIEHLLASLKSKYGIISLLSGIAVALLASYGIKLLDNTPEITISIVTGVILSVIFFRGIPVGPLIGAGIAVIFIKLFDWLKFLIS